MLREMRDAAGDSGEFYTPRAGRALHGRGRDDPRLGETVLDPACGTGGFLVEAFEHLAEAGARRVGGLDSVLQRAIASRLRGQAAAVPALPDEPAAARPGGAADRSRQRPAVSSLREIGERDRVDVILTNPPFGGEEEKGHPGATFPEDKQTAETALLFLQLIMRKLRRARRRLQGSGRAAVVVPNGTLFGDGVCARIKEELLKEFNLHTIVRLPNGVFAPYTSIPTNLLFFDRSGPTKDVWYYEHPLPEGGRTTPRPRRIQFEEFAACLAWWKKREENDRAWKVPARSCWPTAATSTARTRARKEDIAHLPPEQTRREHPARRSSASRRLSQRSKRCWRDRRHENAMA